MKKHFVLLTILVIGVLALSACSGGGTGNATPVGGTEGVPNTGGFATDTFPTDMVGTALPNSESGLSTSAPTTVLSTATSQVAGGGESTSVVAPTSQATSSIPNTGSGELVNLSAMMNFRVQDSNGKDLGRVVDYVVNVCEAHIAYIAVEMTPAGGSGNSSSSTTGTAVTSNGAASTTSAGNVVLIPYQAATTLNGVLGAGVFSNNGTSSSGAVSGTPVNGTSVPSTGSQSNSGAGSLANNSGDVLVVNTGGADLTTFPAVSLSALNSSDVTWEANVINFWGPYMKLGLTTACSVPANGGTLVPTGAAPEVVGTPAVSGTAVMDVSPTRTSNRVTVNKVALASALLNADLTEGNGRAFGKIVDAVIIRNSGGILYYIVQASAGNTQSGASNGSNGSSTYGTGTPVAGTAVPAGTQQSSGLNNSGSSSSASGLIALPPGAVMVRHDGGTTTFYLLVPSSVATSGPAFSGSASGFDANPGSNWFNYWQQYLPMTQSQLP